MFGKAVGPVLTMILLSGCVLPVQGWSDDECPFEFRPCEGCSYAPWGSTAKVWFCAAGEIVPNGEVTLSVTVYSIHSETDLVDGQMFSDPNITILEGKDFSLEIAPRTNVFHVARILVPDDGIPTIGVNVTSRATGLNDFNWGYMGLVCDPPELVWANPLEPPAQTADGGQVGVCTLREGVQYSPAEEDSREPRRSKQKP